MNEQTAAQPIVKPNFTPIVSGVLQRAGAGREHIASSDRECEECKKKRQAVLQRGAQYQPLHPHHIREIAAAMELVIKMALEREAVGQWTLLPKPTTMPSYIQVARTSLGIQISASRIKQANGEVSHFALSSVNGIMAEDIARICADVILRLQYAVDCGELIKGNHGVFHLLIRPRSVKELTR